MYRKANPSTLHPHLVCESVTTHLYKTPICYHTHSCIRTETVSLVTRISQQPHLVLWVDISTLLEQQLCSLTVAISTTIHKRTPPTLWESQYYHWLAQTIHESQVRHAGYCTTYYQKDLWIVFIGNGGVGMRTRGSFIHATLVFHDTLPKQPSWLPGSLAWHVWCSFREDASPLK